jgi:hypothetical protein
MYPLCRKLSLFPGQLSTNILLLASKVDLSHINFIRPSYDFSLPERSFISGAYEMGTGMSAEKVICPLCKKEGKKSKVFLWTGQTTSEFQLTGGYWDENGDFVEPDVEFEPPWYICSYGHITQT